MAVFETAGWPIAVREYIRLSEQATREFLAIYTVLRETDALERSRSGTI
jgi:hypothetical protein